ncbi:MAG TPA: STAS domain-containing protein [Solirubrobacteraceae bacterium]|jgi:anti-sigma B factor antagonist|nr:STAS domain-containing protein [Solirubrobacteraceae bacterium]
MRQPGFALAVDAIGGVLALEARGAIVAGSHDALAECLQQAVRGGRPVVLDLTEADTLDESGVATLMAAQRGLATRLRLVVVRGGPIHEILRRAGVSHVLALHASRAEALAAAGAP